MSTQAERSLRGDNAPGKIYEPLIDSRIVKAEIMALLNMDRSSFDVSNKRFFKIAADAYETARNVAGNIGKGSSVQLSDDAHFSLQEFPQNVNGRDPIQIIRMFYLNMEGKRILTLSRYVNTSATVQDEPENDLDNRFHQLKTTLTSENKIQILEILLKGLDTPRKFKPLEEILSTLSPISPS